MLDERQGKTVWKNISYCHLWSPLRSCENECFLVQEGQRQGAIERLFLFLHCCFSAPLVQRNNSTQSVKTVPTVTQLKCQRPLEGEPTGASLASLGKDFKSLEQLWSSCITLCPQTKKECYRQTFGILSVLSYPFHHLCIARAQELYLAYKSRSLSTSMRFLEVVGQNSNFAKFCAQPIFNWILS